MTGPPSEVRGAPNAGAFVVRDSRETHEVGRRARLELVFSAHRGRTVLSHGYAEPPLRIGRGFERGAVLRFILTSSAPGLFGGDTIEQVVRVEPGALVELASQSALQVHPSLDSLPARVTSHYEVLAGGSLSCWWDPLIPFARSMLEQAIAIDVSPGGRVQWSDALMSGRGGHGEHWAFSTLSHELRLRRNGQLAYLERYRLAPASGGDTDNGPFDARLHGGSQYFGTAFRIGCGDDGAAAEAVHRAVQSIPGVAAAADLLADDLLLVRLAGASGVPFHDARRRAIAALEASSRAYG
ncbi:MAG: urease accessory protein UreD [Vicinamibacterales bacterium]